jgi:hypothetical protein
VVNVADTKKRRNREEKLTLIALPEGSNLTLRVTDEAIINETNNNIQVDKFY